MQCQVYPQVTNLPGWKRAIATPGYMTGAYSVQPNAYSDFPNPMHPNSGYLHQGSFSNHLESVYTDVAITPGARYLYSNYSNSTRISLNASSDFEVYLLSSNVDVVTEFSCPNTYMGLPTIAPADQLSVLHWTMNHHLLGANSTNNFPFDRNGSFVNVPSNFQAAYLLLTNSVTSTAYNSVIHFFTDQVELIEDNFTAGPDQTLICSQTVDLGGLDFGMLSDVRVEYTWVNTTTGATEAQYWVERELDGTFLIFDVINGVFLTQIPVVSVSPGVTTTYQLTRAFIPDTNGTLGGLSPSIFNGIPLTDDVTVIVPSAPTPVPAFTYSINCNAVSFVSDSASTGPTFSHSWDVDGDGVWDYFDPNPTHVYGTNGTFTVVHQVSNGCGALSDTQTITINSNTLSISVSTSLPGPFANGDTFNALVTVTNIGSTPINNIILDVPQGSPDISFSYSPTNIGSLSVGQSTTVTIPVTVTGICGSARVCAQILSADTACPLPLTCSPTVEILTYPALNQAIQVSNSITPTYPAPYVIGGLVEFEVTVTNSASTPVSNIDLNYIANGLQLQTSAPANFALGANTSALFTVLAKVSECSSFTLDAKIEGADDVCPGTSPLSTASGNVTPYTVSVTAPALICAGASGVQADVTIYNPSSQVISDVNLQTTGSSNLFQNVGPGLSPISLSPNSSTSTTFTFDSNGTLGSAFVCANIGSIGSSIPYTCINTTCSPVSVVSGPYSVTLTSTPPNGSPICVDQNPVVSYTLQITNNLSVPLNNLTINSLLTGSTLNAGQSIPSSVSLGPNGTATYTFTATAAQNAPFADLVVDVLSSIPGCSMVSAAVSNPVYRNLNNALQVSAAFGIPGAFVFGQQIPISVTVQNLTPNPISNVVLEFLNVTGLSNIQAPAPFTISGNSSLNFTIPVTVNSCTYIAGLAQIANTSSTCTGIIQSGILTSTISPIPLQVNPIPFICEGSTAMINVQVTNPASVALNNVLLNATGNATGSLFSSLGFSGPVTLNPGVNNLSFPVTALSNVSGTENICVALSQIGNIPYTCSGSQDCEVASVGNPVSITIQTQPTNPSSLCNGNYVNFIMALQNNTTTPITVNFNNTLTGVSLLNGAALSGSPTISPGGYYNLTYVTQVNGSASSAALYVSTNTSIPGCTGTNTASHSIPVNPTLSQALSISGNLTSTFPAPYVVGGQAEFQMTVTNQSSSTVSNIGLNLTGSGFIDYGNAPAPFSLSPGASQSFQFTGTISNCSSFGLTGTISGASGVCSGGGSVSTTATGMVTPYTISISSPAVVCPGATGVQSDVTIYNPSGQTISGVNLSTQLGSIFQNASTVSPITLLPGNNVTGFTYESTGATGSGSVCASLSSINTVVSTIPYTCSGNSACSTVTAGPLFTATLTSTPPNGTPVCVDQNPGMAYSLMISNPNSTDLTNLTLVYTMSGQTLNSGQSIPSQVTVPANSSATYNFLTTAVLGAQTALVQIDLTPSATGCATVTVDAYHPLHHDLNNALQVSASILTSGPYVVGQVVDYTVMVTNSVSQTMVNVDMDYSSLGLTNATASPSLFSIAGNSTAFFNVSGQVASCSAFEFTAEIQSANNTCPSVLPSATVSSAVTPYSVQISGPEVWCDATSDTFTFTVVNPASQSISGVMLATSSSNGLFSFQNPGNVTLASGVNTFTLIATSANGVAGPEVVCGEIVQIGGIPYSCPGYVDCQNVEVSGNPLTLSIQQLGGNVLCSNGTADFEITMVNTTSTNLNGITLAYSTISGFTPSGALPAGINLTPGSSHSFVVSGSVTGTITLCADVTSISNATCGGGFGQACLNNVNVSNLQMPVEVGDLVVGGSSPLSLEAIYDMALDTNGDLYFVGVMTQPQAELIAGGSTIISSLTNCNTTTWPFVVKYTSSGVAWVRVPQTCGIPTAVDVDQFGNVFVGINILSSLQFSGNTYAGLGGITDAAILQYDAAGNEITAKVEGGDGEDYISDLKVRHGKLVITGIVTGLPPSLQPTGYSGTYSLAGAAYSYNYYSNMSLYNRYFGDGFTAAYNYGSGQITNDWSRVITSPIIPNKVEIATGGDVYVIGVALETFAFPQILGGVGQLAVNTTYAGGAPAALSSGNNDIDGFVISYTSMGANRWGRLYGGSGIDYPEVVAVNQNGADGSPVHQNDLDITPGGELYVVLQSMATYLGPPVSGSAYSFQTQAGSHLVNLNTADGSVGSNEWSVPVASPVTDVIGTPPNTITVTGNTVVNPTISADQNGNIYVLSNYYLIDGQRETVDFYSSSGGPAPLTLSSGALFELGLVVEKFDGTGTFQWAEANRSYALYSGPYPPNFTPGPIPMRPMDIEVNACGIYQSIILDGSLDVGGTTYSGAPFDSFIFRLVESSAGLVYARKSQARTADPLEGNRPSEILLYPNPSFDGRVHVQMAPERLEKLRSVSLLNLSGQAVKTVSGVSLGLDHVMEFGDQVSGVYVLRFEFTDSIEMKTVLLRK